MTINELRAAIDYVRACLTELHESAEDRSLDPDEQSRWDEGLAFVADAEAKIERLRSLDRLAHIPTAQETGDPLGSPGSIPEDRTGRVWDLDEIRSIRDASELRSRALTAVEQAAGLRDDDREHVTRFLESLDLDDEDVEDGTRKVARHIIATSSPEYLRAWTKAMKTFGRTGQADVSALSTLQRAMSLTDAAGGFAVPLPVDPTLIPNYAVQVHPFREISTTRQVVTNRLRTVNSTAATASWDGEAAEVSDDATTFANIDITVHKAQVFIPFSIEIGEDYPGFTDDVRMLLQDSKDDLEATAFATGSGTNQPVGIVTALTGGSSVVTSATTDTFAVADVYNVEENLAAKFRARGQWVANKRILNDIRQFGTSDGHALWARLADGQPERLLGYPTHEAEAMDGTINALADNFVLILGDWRFYYIVDRVGFSLELVPHLFHTANNRPSGQRGFYGYWRVGADSVNDRAFRMLNVT